MAIYQIHTFSPDRYLSTDCRELLAENFKGLKYCEKRIELILSDRYFAEDEGKDNDGFFITLEEFDSSSDYEKHKTRGVSSDPRKQGSIDILESVITKEVFIKEALDLLKLEDTVEYSFSNGHFLLNIHTSSSTEKLMLLVTFLLVSGQFLHKNSVREILETSAEEIYKINQRIPPYFYSDSRLEAILLLKFLLGHKSIDLSNLPPHYYEGITEIPSSMVAFELCTARDFYDFYKKESKGSWYTILKLFSSFLGVYSQKEIISASLEQDELEDDDSDGGSDGFEFVYSSELIKYLYED